MILLKQKTDLFLSRIIKICFPLRQRLGRFTYSPLYLGGFLSLGFLSCDTSHCVQHRLVLGASLPWKLGDKGSDASTELTLHDAL